MHPKLCFRYYSVMAEGGRGDGGGGGDDNWEKRKGGVWEGGNVGGEGEDEGVDSRGEPQEWEEDGTRWRWWWGVLEYLQVYLPPPGMTGPSGSFWQPAIQYRGRAIEGYVWTSPDWPRHGGYWRPVTAGARREVRLHRLRESSFWLSAWFRDVSAWEAEAATRPHGPAPLHPPTPRAPPSPPTPPRSEASSEIGQVVQ